MMPSLRSCLFWKVGSIWRCFCSISRCFSQEKLFGKRSISVQELPAMKDPGSSKGPKGAKDAEASLIRDCLTNDRMAAAEKEAKNLNGFLKQLNAIVGKDCEELLKRSGLGEKRISKLINRVGTEWWKQKK